MSGAFAVACLEERSVLPAAIACDDQAKAELTALTLVTA